MTHRGYYFISLAGGVLERFFAKNWNGGPFVLFGPDHLAIIAFFVLFNLSFFWLRRIKSERFRSQFRLILAITLLLFEVAWQTWSITVGKWNIRENLPLHMCSLFLFINSIMVITRSKTLYEISYCLGIGSGLQAFLTPDPGPYGLWHFVAVQTIFGHGLLITLTIYMTIVEGFRPKWSSIPKTYLFGVSALLFTYLVNRLLGSNYMFTMHKPGSASLLDLLGPYPWYLLSMAGAALLIMLVLVAPWEIWKMLHQDREKMVINI
jgi:hypothetical integral membrane protein (TIGR02206 family)